MRSNTSYGAPPALVILLGGILGLLQFAFFFSDLPGAPAIAPRVVAAAAVAALSGLALGRLRPAAGPILALLSVWGAIFWGAAFAAMRADGWLAVLAVPPAVAVLGGLAGATWGRRRKRSPGARA